ncbi:MAG: tail fiber protein [Deltaproteobacteria bacterium]|nr:tail fiber protein [Deltaproteobacteria bacterium]
MRIHRYDLGFYAPSNWLLVAVVNGDDNTLKLGTGVILSQKSSSSKGSSLPRGTIVMWSGGINTMPDGWALCDGQNNTPDLRGRFIMGRTNDGEAAAGGASSHNHATGYPQNDVPATTAVGGISYELSGKFHVHAVTAADQVPPFFKLAFIMKPKTSRSRNPRRDTS